MKNGNPDVCEVHSNGFLLDIKLFPSAASKQSQFDLLGSTIQIGKPAALKLTRDLENNRDEPYKEVVVNVLDKEYQTVRINISRFRDRYKFMDIEQSVLLGYVYESTLKAFAGDEKS